MPISIEVLNLIVSSAAAIFTLIAGTLVWWQTSQHFRHSRSASYIERFNSEEYFTARMAVDRLAAVDPTFESIIKAEVGREKEELERARLHVLMFANIFQEIGAAYRFKLLDRRYTWSVFGFLAQYYWQRLSPFILRLRAIRSRPELYRDFERLALEMARLDGKLARYQDKKFGFRPRKEGALFVFAYGSLMSPDSARKSVELSLDCKAFERARLYGYERGWFSFAAVRLGEGPTALSGTMAFLALRKCHEAFCNGVLIPVSKQDLAKLDVRERGYQRVDVTPFVFPSTNGQVFTYIVDQQDEAAANVIVSSEYVSLVEAAAKAYGEDFLAEYQETTKELVLRTTSERYSFSDPGQNQASGRE